MEAERRDAESLAIPLLLQEDEKKAQKLVEKDTDVEAQPIGHHSASAGTTSFFKTCFNGLNALSGIGILSTPHALSSGGWLSLIALFLIAAATFYTGMLIKRCMDADPNVKTYPDIGQVAFGKKGRLVVSVFMNLELYLVATSFLILEGDNLHNLFPIDGVEIAGFRIGGKQVFVMAVALIILPTVMLNNMSMVSYISATGVLASIIILGSILLAGTYDGIGFHEKGRLLDWSGIPTAVSLYAFCYCAHPVFPTLYTSMKDKSKFSTVLLLCFIFCTIIYASMAVSGYLMFGSNVNSQITLNLPVNRISSKVAIYTTLINPIAKYALMITPIVNAIENRFAGSIRKSAGLVIRISLVISTMIVALAIPFFGYLMSLVGAFLSLTAAVILPCLCYLKVSGTYRIFRLKLVVIAGILLAGILVAIVGTYTSLAEIIGNL